MSVELIPLILALASASGPVGDGVTVKTVDGHTMTGRLAGAPEGHLGLWSSHFAEVLRIDVDRVAEIKDPKPGPSPRLEDDSFAFELLAGDRILATIVDVTADTWVLEASGLGRIAVPRTEVTAVENLGGSRIVYNGPHGARGWRQVDDKHTFVALGSALTTEDPRARIDRDLGLLSERELRIDLSWSETPRFRIGVGHRNDRAGLKRSVTLEVWGSSLVAWRERGPGLELVELIEGLEPASSLVLRLRVDPERVSFFGETWGELGTISRQRDPGDHLSIANDGAGLTLHSVRALEGRDRPPPRRLDEASLVGFDPQARALVTADGPVSLDGVVGLDLDPPQESDPPRESVEGASPVWLTYSDGRRVIGELVGTEADGLRVRVPWHAEALTCQRAGLVSLTRPGAEIADEAPTRSALHTHLGEVPGELTAVAQDGTLTWRPAIAENAVTMHVDSIERVVLNRETANFVSKRRAPHLLRLWSGDSLRCRLLSIEGDRLRLDSPHFGECEIDAGLVQAVEFDLRAMDRARELFGLNEEPEERHAQRGLVIRINGMHMGQKPRRETSKDFDPRSLERALSLPRKYKRRGFEHLILAKNGDFLRTELLEWSEEGALIPGTADLPRRIPADRLAAVVWLGEAPAGAGRDLAPPALVHLDEHHQIGLELRGLADGQLQGSSPIFGELRLEVNKIHALQFGAERVPDRLYDDWILRPMREPFANAAPGVATGKVAVGDPAPATRGQDLDGVPFDLADYRGKVVVLDFWGHW